MKLHQEKDQVHNFFFYQLPKKEKEKKMFIVLSSIHTHAHTQRTQKERKGQMQDNTFES